MTALPSTEAFLSGGSASAKFETIGAAVSGVIAEQPQVQQQTDYKTGSPLFWADGNPKVQLAVTLQTEEGTGDDDGRRRVYVKNQMRQAVVEALRKANVKALEVGGTMTVTYVADGVAAVRGNNPPKQYAVQYVPPAAADQAAFLGTETPAPQTAPQQVAIPPVAGGSQFTPEQLAAMKAAGVDVSQFGG